MKQHFLKTTLFGVSLICLVGCVSQNYTVPNLADMLHYTAETQEKYKADQQWWNLYQNEELNKVVDLALNQNPDYLKAAIKVNKAMYALNLSTADLFPTLRGDLGASAQKNIKHHDTTRKNFSGELGLSYELDLFGKIRDARSAQDFELQATVMDEESARLALVNNVVDLFFDLSCLDNAIKLTNGNIKSYQDLYDISRNKYRAGKVDRAEVAQAEQSLISEKSKLLQQQTQFKELESTLRNILNLKPEEKLEIVYNDLLKQQEAGIDLEVPMAVLANRPDLMAAQFRLEKSFKNLTASEKNWYPNISLRGAISSSSEHAKNTFDVPYVFGSIGVDLPFLDWTRVQNNVKISEADYQIARIEFEDTLTQALNETGYYYFAYSTSKQIYENTSKNYKNAQRITKYYDNRYQMGKAEFKDWLQALNTEHAMRQEMIQQKYQIIKYENYIYKAMGGKYKG